MFTMFELIMQVNLLATYVQNTEHHMMSAQHGAAFCV